jgi:hypothetical protein
MGDHHDGHHGYFGQEAGGGSGGAHRRDDRSQPEALLDMLTLMDSARGAAVRRGDTAGERTALAARVACWTALADLAETVHPAYGSACRQAALAEQAAMTALPVLRRPRARSAAPGGWHPVPRPRRPPEPIADGPRHAQRDRVDGPAG